MKGPFLMEFLHVMPPSQRMMSGYLFMLKQYFMSSGEDVHKIMYNNEVFKADSGLLMFDNTVHFPDMGKGKLKKFLYIKNAFEHADRIVFHCFQPDDKWLLTTYLLRKHLSKAVWVIWGIDLYNFEVSSKTLAGRIRNKINLDLRRRMRYPVAISEADVDVYQEKIGTYPVLCGAYPFMDARFFQMDTFLKENNRQKAEYAKKIETGELEEDYLLHILPNGQAPAQYDGRTRVLVGHNAFPFNNHIKSIDAVRRFVMMDGGEKIELCMPLNYGETSLSKNVSYIDALIQYCSTLAVPFHVSYLKSMLTANDYTRYLSTIDIGIFNAERQSGLGNILQLLYMGKKVYMTQKNPLFSFLTEKGFEIHDTEELNTITLEEFLKPVQTPFPNPWIKSSRNIDSVAAVWDKIFGCIRGEIEPVETLKQCLKMLGN